MAALHKLTVEAPPAIRLARMLDDRGLTLRDLARAVGVSTYRAESWARNRVAPPERYRATLDAWLLSQGIHPRRAFALEADMSDRTPPHLRLVKPDPLPPATPDEDTMPEFVSREYLDPEQLARLELTADPFEDGESDEAFLPPWMRSIESALVNAITARHIVALTGPMGAGKTSLIRHLYARLSGERRIQLVMPATLDRRAITANTLAVAILRDMTGRDTASLSPEARAELLRKTLADAVANKVFPVLVIDEAHLMSASGLVAVKQLWDAGLLNRQLAIILVGWPELAARLRKDPAARELGGRTRILEVRKYSVQDTAAYLKWRFQRVGADVDKVFTPDAFPVLAAKGEVPMFIGNHAVRALKYALSLGDRQVTGAHVGKA